MIRKSNISIILIMLIFYSHLVYASTPEQKDYNIIVKHYQKKDIKSIVQYSNKFLKKYPKSSSIPHVKLILAEIEKDPQKAIDMFKNIINKHANFEKNDYVQYRICEILYLLSKWSALKTESLRGKNKYAKSSYSEEYKIFLIHANINLEKMDDAKKDCIELTKNNHNYAILGKVMLLLSYINKKSSGLSRDYIYNLREIALGFKDSEIIQTTIYLLGEFYEYKKNYNQAYSAYLDVIERFPKSPEAMLARNKIKLLKKHNPVRVEYIPDSKTVKNTDAIDISPEIEITESDIDSFYYAISIGPFSSLKNANKIKDLIIKIDQIKTIQLMDGYALFMGRYSDSAQALNIKIRLAEEYGINGKIVRISSSEKRKYIYGE